MLINNIELKVCHCEERRANVCRGDVAIPSRFYFACGDCHVAIAPRNDKGFINSGNKKEAVSKVKLRL